MTTRLSANSFALRPDFGTLGSETARRVVEHGHDCVPDVVDSRWRSDVLRLAESVNQADTREVLLEGMTGGDGHAIETLLTDPELTVFIEAVATHLHPRANPADRHVDITLRVINAPDHVDAPTWYHYDATVVTVIMPIEMPESGGELILYPNRRPFRRFVLTNIIEKMVMQSDTYRRRIRGGEPTIVRLDPGNAYVFSGYRSYHATLPCPEGARRVTLMVHYRDAHGGSRLLRAAKSWRTKVIR